MRPSSPTAKLLVPSISTWGWEPPLRIDRNLVMLPLFYPSYKDVFILKTALAWVSPDIQLLPMTLLRGDSVASRELTPN